MPAQSKKSQVAKQKRIPGRATFTRPENTPTEETSDYHPSDNNSDTSTTNTDSRNNRYGDNRGVEGVQRLYSAFLPPHLQLKDSTRGKRRKLSNRPVVYTKDSLTTIWRRKTELRKAAEGCATLDLFIIRKVCSSRVLRATIFSFLIASRSANAALHQRRNKRLLMSTQ